MRQFYRYATLATIVATMLLGLLAWPGLATEAGISSANLAITKSVMPTVISRNGVVTYTISLTNTSATTDATGVFLTDTLPISVTFARWVAQSAGAGVIGNVLTWTGPITAGQAITFSFVARHTGSYGEVVTNTVFYSAAITGTAVATFTVEPQPVIYLPVVIKPTAQVNDLKIAQFEFERRDEFVEIKNNGPGNQLMDGWQIFSVVGPQTFDFPSGITLAAGQTLRVHSGPDAVENIPNDLRWTTAYIWNNNGDKAELKDSQGVVRDTSCYRNGCP